MAFNIGQRNYSSELIVKSDKFVGSNFVECKSNEKFRSFDKDKIVTLLSRLEIKLELEVKLDECNFIANTFWIKKSCR